LFLKGTLGKNPLGYSTHPCVSPCGPAAAPLFASASCLRSRRIRRERIRRAAGWPRSAQREGARPMDGPSNPTLSAMDTLRRAWGVLRFWRCRLGDLRSCFHGCMRLQPNVCCAVGDEPRMS
jgi:hypothetical protein